MISSVSSGMKQVKNGPIEVHFSHWSFSFVRNLAPVLCENLFTCLRWWTSFTDCFKFCCWREQEAFLHVNQPSEFLSWFSAGTSGRIIISTLADRFWERSVLGLTASTAYSLCCSHCAYWNGIRSVVWRSPKIW